MKNYSSMPKQPSSERIIISPEEERRLERERRLREGRRMLSEVYQRFDTGKSDVIEIGEYHILSISLYPAGTSYKTGILDEFELDNGQVNAVKLKGVVKTQMSLHDELNGGISGMVKKYTESVKKLPHYPILIPERIDAESIYSLIHAIPIEE